MLDNIAWTKSDRSEEKNPPHTCFVAVEVPINTLTDEDGDFDLEWGALFISLREVFGDEAEAWDLPDWDCWTIDENNNLVVYLSDSDAAPSCEPCLAVQARKERFGSTKGVQGALF